MTSSPSIPAPRAQDRSQLSNLGGEGRLETRAGLVLQDYPALPQGELGQRDQRAMAGSRSAARRGSPAPKARLGAEKRKGGIPAARKRQDAGVPAA
jgi:hypothetical protein